MPKMKTHSGSNKRFRLTGTGKVMRRRANRKHLLEHKPSTRTRRLKNEVVLVARRRQEDQATAGKVTRPATNGSRESNKWHA